MNIAECLAKQWGRQKRGSDAMATTAPVAKKPKIKAHVSRPSMSWPPSMHHCPSTLYLQCPPPRRAPITTPRMPKGEALTISPYMHLSPLSVDVGHERSGPLKLSADVAKLLGGHWYPEDAKKALPVLNALHSGGVMLESRVRDI